jgi:hypothetical protein
MHNDFPNEWTEVGLLGGPKSGVKSLFQKISAVSLCGSRFWRDQALSPSQSHQLLEIKTLEKRAEKNCDPSTAT